MHRVKLTTEQMAEFAASGLLALGAVVPDAINKRFMAAITEHPEESPSQHYQRLMRDAVIPTVTPGVALNAAYPDESPVNEILQVPEVAGAITSLVGEQAVVDHHFMHITFPGGVAQHNHQDSTIDPRQAFDVQLFYFPHEVTLDMGGTRYIPGTHLRIVSEMSIGRYQNMLGQQHVVCPAGSVYFFHHGLWHGAGVNRSDQKRYVLKIRLCPTQRQCRLWNTDDLLEDNAQEPIFWKQAEAARNPVHDRLTRPDPWFEQDTGRLEYINRIRFWRYLIGDNTFDADYWLTRVENEIR